MLGTVLRTFLCSLADITADDLRYSRTTGPRPRLEITPAGPPELALLGRLLGAGDDQAILRGFRLLAGESQEPPWVIGVPEELRDLLASIGENALPRLADAWATALQAEPTSTLDILRGIRDLAVTGPGPLALHVTGRP